MRLAPSNLVVSGALAGASISIRTGRIGLSPFGEVGVARLHGRYNAGSYSIQMGTGSVDIPIWRTVTSDVVGVGGGVILELLVLPHIALTGIAAHWNFRTDARLQPIPSVFAGVGLALAY
jgi:hypothetical protein